MQEQDLKWQLVYIHVVPGAFIPCFCRMGELENVRCIEIPLPASLTAHSLQRTALPKPLLFIVIRIAPIELVATARGTES